jgi:hypothetical protein
MKKIEEMKQYVCDNLCTYPCQIKDVEMLEEICAECMFEEYTQELEAMCEGKENKTNEK